ncbi:c-type cytochrome biogenesis protein CcmI [Parendozoicomonas sp. Alg238-R29]|uniref:c-type cytochrome biogenesis protein CcmI n=1 Tax=Parendozoicomonas sp. Alg238-R29 TaxID=2993446 RepID=UPI00248E64BF|nr:c-type cytochrome biogenesis protein CcmI [Parendozoicomonas sp. Alg238-R29]
MSETVTLFWVGAAVLIILALMFVCLPLMHFRRNPVPADELDQEQVNLKLRQDQLADLKARLSAGQLNQDEFNTQKSELERSLLADLDGLQEDQQSSRGSLVTPLVLAAFIPFLAIGLYFRLGASDQLRQTAALEELSKAHNSAEGLAGMERIIEEWPEDFQTRFVLAGFYMSSGRFEDAATHYGVIVKQTGGQQAEPLAQQAQALYMANDSQMTPRVDLLIRQALNVEPENTTALGLAGISSFESGDFPEAIKAWKTLLGLTSDPAAREALAAGVARAQREMGIEPEHQAADARVSLKVNISLDEALADIPETAQIFLYARSVGSPMPLVILPLTVADLPGTFELGDAQAMMAGVTLTNQQRVDVVVRVSLTGNVMQPDYEVKAENVEVGSGSLTNLVVAPGEA